MNAVVFLKDQKVSMAMGRPWEKPTFPEKTRIFSRGGSSVCGYEELPEHLVQAFRAMEIVAPPEKVIVSTAGAVSPECIGRGEMDWLPTSFVEDGARAWVVTHSWSESGGGCGRPCDYVFTYRKEYIGGMFIRDAEFQKWASDLFKNHPLAKLIENDFGNWFNLVLPPENDPRNWSGVEITKEDFGRRFEFKWGRCIGHIVVRLGVNPPKKTGKS